MMYHGISADEFDNQDYVDVMHALAAREEKDRPKSMEDAFF